MNRFNRFTALRWMYNVIVPPRYRDKLNITEELCAFESTLNRVIEVTNANGKALEAISQDLEDIQFGAGGYYRPAITENEDGSVTFSFVASDDSMPPIEEKTFFLGDMQTITKMLQGFDGDPMAVKNYIDEMSGGYYTPVFEQNGNTVEVSFLASNKMLPALEGYSFTLPSGSPGKSAYDSYLDNGGMLSEKDWVNSLKGADGESFYQMCVNNGFKGSETDLVIAMKGVGIKSIEKTSTSGLVDTYTITLTDNTTATFTVTNGAVYKTATIPAHWEAPVNECIAKIKALQDGRNCVTFPFFSDNHTRDGNPQYMGMLIARVMEECGIPYCFCGGDAITSAIASNKDSEGNFIDTDTDFRNQAQAFKDAMSYIPNGRFCMALGNHETYLAKNPNISGSTREEYTRAQTYDIFLREQGSWQNKHFGGDGTYYYVDDLPSKVRFIVLNTNGIGDTNIDHEQLAWFENTALKFNESGWGVVIISHIPITNHYAQSNIGNNAAVISMLQDYMSGEDENKADIIGWFSGHIHRDRIYEGVSVNDTDSSESENKMGFKQVTITSDHTVIAYKNDDGTTSPTYHPVSTHGCGNTCVKNHAIDFVTVNKDKKTVNITRLGIGSDRSYTYGVYEEPTITNFADPSNTSEWLHDTRLNSANTTACTGMTTTNYIDTEEGDIVTVSGIDLDVCLGTTMDGAVSTYAQTNKTNCASRAKTRSSETFVSEVNGVYTFGGVVGYIRFCGVPTNGDEGVVINIQRNGVWM